MPNETDIKPANLIATLIEFRWGLAAAPTYARYAAWTANVTYAGNVYTALPTIDVQYSKIDGSLKDAPATINMQEVSPLDQMRQPFHTVHVTITEVRPGTDATAYITHKGRIAKVTYNPAGNEGIVRVDVGGYKNSLAGALSLTIGQFCPWTHGSGPCESPIETNKETGTITAINGQAITITGLTTLNDPDWWQAGEVQYNEFGLSIYKHTINTNNFVLYRPAPAFWLNKVVKVYPGCLKLIANCRHPRRNQEANFGAMGIKIPNRDPRYEAGA